MGASPLAPHPPPRPGFPFGPHTGPLGQPGPGLPPGDPLSAAYAAGGGLPNNVSPAAAAALGAYRAVSLYSYLCLIAGILLKTTPVDD